MQVTGETMPAYFAEPDGLPRGGIIVIQEIFGVSEAMRDVANLLAGDGWLAIVPALFHRTDPHFTADYDEAGFAKGRAAAGALDVQQIVADLTAAHSALAERLPAGGKVGAWGFCFGGSLAYFSATLPSVSAAASFYGGQIGKSPAPGRPAMMAMTDEIHAPLFLAFGADDESIPPAEIETIREALVRHRRTYDLHVYPNAGHAFFRGGPHGNEASADAWTRVRAFFAANLEHS